MTPPQELLLRAALLDGDAALSAWRAWRTVNELDSIDDASFHLLPRLYFNLQRVGAHGDPCMPKLRGVYRHAWMRSTVTKRAAADTVERLNAAGVRALLLGGIALDLCLRHDAHVSLAAVDLHVEEEQLPAAVPALERAGWMIGDAVLIAKLAPFTPAIATRNPRWAGTTLRLHLHPFAVGCPPEAERELWQRGLRSEIQGSPVLVPDPTDLLILTCLGGRTPDPALACSWIAYALALTGAAGHGINWDAFSERSRRLGLARPVHKALLDLHRRFEPAVPAATIERAAAEVAAHPAGGARFWSLTHDPRRRPPLVELLVAHWTRYSTGCRTNGWNPTLLGLARYVLLQCRRGWRVRRRPRLSIRNSTDAAIGPMQTAAAADQGARRPALQPRSR